MQSFVSYLSLSIPVFSYELITKYGSPAISITTDCFISTLHFLSNNPSIHEEFYSQSVINHLNLNDNDLPTQSSPYVTVLSLNSQECIVFKRLSTYFQSTLDLFFQKYQHPYEALFNFTLWLTRYRDMFDTKCDECNNILMHETGDLGLLPPTVRTLNGVKKSLHIRCSKSNL